MKYMRENVIDEYGICALQDKILEIAVYIDKLCCENNINYFLMGGSALGAIRHKGFIPWDDDLDIFMKPDDFAQFRELFNCQGDKDHFYLQEFSRIDGMVACAKLRLNNTTYIEDSVKDWKIHHGIYVDIFILHNTPSNKILSFFQCICAKLIIAKSQSRKKVSYKGVKGLFVNLMKFLPRRFGLRFCLKNMYMYDNRDCDCVCHFMGKAFFGEGIYSSKYFHHGERVRFENVELMAPCNSHEYLTDRFGDYMKLPPKSSIKQTQHAWKWDANNDFSLYINSTRDFSDEKTLML